MEYENNIHQNPFYGNPKKENSIKNSDPVIYTVADVKKILKCGLKQAYEIANTKGFPAIRLGKKIIIEKKALEEWLNKNRGKTIFI